MGNLLVINLDAVMKTIKMARDLNMYLNGYGLEVHFMLEINHLVVTIAGDSKSG